jgi:hypothetical protein
MVEVALTSLATTGVNSSEGEMVVEDLFGMTMRFSRYAPDIVISSVHLQRLVQGGVLCLAKVQRRETLDALAGFFATMLSMAQQQPAMADVARHAVPELLKSLMELLKGGCGEETLMYFPEILQNVGTFVNDQTTFRRLIASAMDDRLPQAVITGTKEKESLIHDLAGNPDESAGHTRTLTRLQEIAKRCRQRLRRVE